ncbi:glyoxalase/bleomycin resistance/dioxygenase family protein [Acidipropionibacterium acidipropionici]|uniref:Glyoxalase n=1 Tax=Acidipropionibacterium acidipropionici TaxID=1748 RepID=A0AAC8YGK5_9ACTN|nr:VOC family protein [Acidipropionibacterium acidipropionici]AMS06030.1 glyoxalase [Acidipropionibacterium acidipropionici]AOZ47493.1 glyoxalase [Acidipropionibacterium acidipropionici]AZP39584.1 glyoxalase/bleomycin resistance/dioxygenase family protein [Acidipropionibacterium acidipropionici]
MAIASQPSFVMDCPEPRVLAEFYGELLGWTVEVEDDESWAEISHGEIDFISFQQVADYRAPQWPGQEVPQQMHLDVAVENLDDAEAAVLRMGATKHECQPSERGSFRVFLDPAGHPFCLCAAAGGGTVGSGS